MFDARVSVGFDKRLGDFQESAEPKSLLRVMDEAGIEKALIRAGSGLGPDVMTSNERLFKIASGNRRFVPAPMVIPNSAGETGDEDRFVTGLLAGGARAVWLYPTAHTVPLVPAVVERLFRALEAHSVPLFIERDEISSAELAGLCADYPLLPVVISGAGHWAGRWIYAFLEKHPKLHIDTAPPGYTNEGIEYLAKRLGTDRLLFASDYPACHPSGLVAYVQYAGISSAGKEAIGRGNLERLIACVR